MSYAIFWMRLTRGWVGEPHRPTQPAGRTTSAAAAEARCVTGAVSFSTIASHRQTRPSVQKHRVVEGEAHPENRMIPSNKQNYHFHDSSAVSPKTF